VPLGGEELRARRDRAREQRRRRRLTTLAGLALAAIAVALVASVVAGGGGRSPHATTSVVATAVPTTPAVHRVSHHASHAATTGEAALELAAIRRAAAANDYVVRGSAHKRLVALTFDDGPGPTTPRILAWLKAHHVPATFFLIGASARAQPKLVREEVAAGDAVGDHTETHADLGRLSVADQQNQISGGEQAITAITGRHVRLFRPPYGSFDPDTLGLLRNAGLLMVLWTVDTKDYSMPGVDKIVFTALSGARAGTIILFHDGGGDRSQTLAALPRIVHRLRIKGYRLVTVPKLLVSDPVPANQPPPHSLAGG
jgi:peptidoglycan/xylan/chitin deacetylase (PgdA/CDA1 family)